MIPATYNPKVYQGEDWTQTFVFPFDLTGYVIDAQINSVRENGVVLSTFAIGSGFTVSGVGNNNLVWTIGHEVSAALPSNYQPVYDIRVTDPGGSTHVYLTGNIIVTARITE